MILRSRGELAGFAHAALYVSRPDGTLDPVIRHALEIDPFKSAIEPDSPSVKK